MSDTMRLFQLVAEDVASCGCKPDDRVSSFWVPGRIEVLGKHTDYAGGQSVLVASQRGFCAIVFPTESKEVVFRDVKGREEAVFSLEGLRMAKGPAWATYPEAVCRRICANFGNLKRGGVIAFASNLPIAAGMSSSSAFIILSCLGLDALGNFKQTSAFNHNVIGALDFADYLGHIENGQSYKDLIGDKGVGTFGGSQDHLAIMMARPRQFMHARFKPSNVLGYTPVPDGMIFCIASSGVKAEKTAGAKEKYNAAAVLANQVLDVWNADRAVQADSLAAILGAHQIDREAFLSLLRTDSVELANRFEQFSNEVTCYIPAFLQAVEGRDHINIQESVRASQFDAENKLNNQIPETCMLTRDALTHGALASSAFGAGFGGAVWALIEKSKSELFLQNWSKSYYRAYPEYEDAQFFLDETGPAAFSLGTPF